MKTLYDCIVVGSGVVGSAIARELMRYELKVGVLEKNLDVCNETSGRNSAVVHGGFANPTGSLKAKCCVEGNRIMSQLSDELDFPFKRCGKLLVGNTEEDRKSLERTLEQGRVNGSVGLRMIDKDEMLSICPYVTGSFALLSESSGIMDPFLYTIGLAENAKKNGADFFFNHRVIGIERVDGVYYVKTNHGDYQTRWVINAAGLGATQVSAFVGLTDKKVIYSRSNYIILNKRMGRMLPLPVYPVPSNIYMGIHITPTVDGNVTIGPDAENTDDPTYYGVPEDKIESLASEGDKLWPHISARDRIRIFSGIQPKAVDGNGNIIDWQIDIDDKKAPNFVSMIGIESPGLTGSVPLARYVIDMMKEREKFTPNPDFDPRNDRHVKFSELSLEEKNALIKENPDYGEVVCSCEEITKKEVIDAIHNPLGVCTLTGIKYRTRAMMGLCQGGFCQMKIYKLIEEELGKRGEDIRYSSLGSWLTDGELRKENE